jgi:hypothetical protein
MVDDVKVYLHTLLMGETPQRMDVTFLFLHTEPTAIF